MLTGDLPVILFLLAGFDIIVVILILQIFILMYVWTVIFGKKKRKN